MSGERGAAPAYLLSLCGAGVHVKRAQRATPQGLTRTHGHASPALLLDLLPRVGNCFVEGSG